MIVNLLVMKNLLGKIMNKFSRPAPEVERPCADIEKAGLLARPDAEVFSEATSEVSAIQHKGNIGSGALGTGMGESRIAERCPYCSSTDFVKRGVRKKKFETVQLYLCRACSRVFTAQFVKGKKFPVNVIMAGLTIYNLGHTLEATCRALNQKFGVNPGASTLSGWVEEYVELCRYSRLRPYATKMCSPEKTIETVTMAHRQLYRFSYHRPKIALALQVFKNRYFEPLKDYLDAVSAETPHQYFQEGGRMSEVKTKFSKAQMIVHSKQNYANRLAEFVLQGVSDNKARHERLQMFMVANDSVTVASEVPVYIRKEDIEHMENVLNFKIWDRPVPEVELGVEQQGTDSENIGNETATRPAEDKVGAGVPRLLTGHIDLLQIRNGQIHILDYKPNAAKEKPIEQLEWYALALSRLTGLRLYEFKCGWFDEKDYFEFYPLHVVKKISDRKKKKVYLKNKGMAFEIPRENKLKIV